MESPPAGRCYGACLGAPATCNAAAAAAAAWQNIGLNAFDAEYFCTLGAAEQKGLLRCLASGIQNADSQMGCYACQPADYDRFKP